jgi:hypothetical protein
VKNASKRSEFARNWSDKKIAHSDYEYRVGEQLLSPASRQAVDETIDSIADLVKWVSSEKFNTTLVTHPITPADDEVTFLQHLYEGRSAFARKEELSRKYSLEGKYDERDQLYCFPDWLQRDERILDI